MQFPKISIVTPNFNGGKYLEQTIVSLLGQNYPNLEYIVMDGGSTDNSLDIIRKYESKISYWVSEPDEGLYHAIQKGFSRASGDIMGWLNSDDMHHPFSLFSIAEIFGSFPEVKWLTGNPSFFDEMGRTVHCWGIQRFNKYDFLMRQDRWLQQESTFWKKSLWQQAGAQLDTNYKLAADFELWTRFSRLARLYLTDTLLAGFRFRSSNQLTLESSAQYKTEMEQIIKKNLSSQSLAGIRLYRFLYRLNKGLGRTQIYNQHFFDLAIRSVFKENNPIIRLDRMTQQYQM